MMLCIYMYACIVLYYACDIMLFYIISYYISVMALPSPFVLGQKLTVSMHRLFQLAGDAYRARVCERTEDVLCKADKLAYIYIYLYMCVCVCVCVCVGILL